MEGLGSVEHFYYFKSYLTFNLACTCIQFICECILSMSNNCILLWYFSQYQIHNFCGKASFKNFFPGRQSKWVVYPKHYEVLNKWLLHFNN